VALNLHSRREIASAERLDAGLQALQSCSETADHRVGPDPDSEREQREQKEQSEPGIPVVVLYAGY